MKTERIIRIFAGAIILTTLTLGIQASPFFVSKYFLFITYFVGINLLQSGFTNFCPLEIILKKFGFDY